VSKRHTRRNSHDHPIHAREHHQARRCPGRPPELRLTSGGNAVATLIVYTNYLVRNDDGSTRQESERHRVIVWGLHAQKAARLLRKGSKVRVQGCMTYPTWKDKQTGATRYGAEIVAQTLDEQGANDEVETTVAESATEAPAPQPAEPVATVQAPAKPKRRRTKTTEIAAAKFSTARGTRQAISLRALSSRFLLHIDTRASAC
jgi:single-strand DNA-binding protein